jgi:predicted membrane channel-forming protein YqfA (hemolysin III family)
MISLLQGPEFLAIGFVALFCLLGLLGFLFWIWMIVDCATNESNEGNTKVVWILIIVFLHILGALIYGVFRRPQRIRELGK